MAAKGVAPVGDPPKFKDLLFIRQDDERLMFECSVFSPTDPEIIWYHNDLKVKSDTKNKIEMKKEPENLYRLTLEIKDPGRKDAGKWDVQAKNPGGQAKTTAFSYIE